MSMYPIALPERLVQAVLESEMIADYPNRRGTREHKPTVAMHEDWWGGLAWLPPAGLLVRMAHRLR